MEINKLNKNNFKTFDTTQVRRKDSHENETARYRKDFTRGV